MGAVRGVASPYPTLTYRSGGGGGSGSGRRKADPVTPATIRLYKGEMKFCQKNKKNEEIKVKPKWPTSAAISYIEIFVWLSDRGHRECTRVRGQYV